MQSIMGKLLRSLVPAHEINSVRFMSASSNITFTEKDVEEIEIPVPWGHIAGKWWGDKCKPPVLAIHGWQDNANSFDKLIPHLNVPSVLAIDLPGHGLSSHIMEGRAYDFLEHIVMIHRVKKHFNWEQMPLLTHSLGAALGFAYASIFPNEVKWVINLECARTLMTLVRSDIHTSFSKGIDNFLKLEKLKRKGSPPAYKLDKMIEMTIEGSLGSITSPETAMILLKRGMQEANDTSVKNTVKVTGYLEEFIRIEMKALDSLSAEEKSHTMKIFSHLMENVKRGKEALKTFPLTEKDEKYYIFKRDPSVKILIFQSFDENFITEASKAIKCPFLSLRAKQGFLFGSTKKMYENTLNILKTNSVYLEHHDVDGTHHAHLNAPESLAPIINNFIEKCETLNT